MQEVLKLKQSITERKTVNAELTAQRDSLRDSLEMDRNRLEQLDHDIAEAVVTKRRVSSEGKTKKEKRGAPESIRMKRFQSCYVIDFRPFRRWWGTRSGGASTTS